MKGMQRISRGSGFRGALNYAFFDKKNPGPKDKQRGYDGDLIGGNMAGSTPRELAAEFKLARELRPDIGKPVWHQSLRLPKDEKLDHDQWLAIADDYMYRMGFNDGHQRAYILHDDIKGQHIHIIASRVDLAGNVNLGRHESMKSTAHLQQLEKDYGLTITKGPNFTLEGKLEVPDVKRVSKNEMEMGLRTGIKPARMQLQNAISIALKDGPTMRAFVERLEAAEIKVVPNIASTGRVSGLAFELDGVHFKGSDLGKAFGWSGLQKEGLQYEQTRDAAFLAELRERADLKSRGDAARNAGPAARADQQPEPALPAPAVAGFDERADAGPASAVEPVRDRVLREIAVDRKQEAGVDAQEAGRKPEQSGELDPDLRSRPDLGRGERNPSRVAEVIQALEQLPAAERNSLIRRIITKIREMLGLKKELVNGRDGPARGIELGKRDRGAAHAGATGKPGDRNLGRGLGASAKPSHRARAPELAPGPLAHLRDRMQHMSLGHVGASWGHAKSTLFENVSGRVDERRSEPDRGLFGEGRGTSTSAVTPAPVFAPRPIVAKTIERARPAAKLAPVFDDAERKRRIEFAAEILSKRAEPLAARAASEAPAGPAGQPRTEEPARARLRALVEKALAGKGVSKSEALYRSAEAGDMDLVERLLDEGAAIESKRGNALDAAAVSGHEDVFKKLVGASSVQDHNDLRDLSSRCLSAEARQKLESLAMQARSQGGHTAGLGVDGPLPPASSGLQAGPQSTF